MAWDTHPYSYSGHLYIHKPEVVLTGRVSTSTTVEGIHKTITLSSISGTIGDVLPGMTITCGSSAGARDLGACMALGYSSTNILLIWASGGILSGEITPTTNAYITVWDDYRVWLLPPYMIEDVLWRPTALVDFNPYTSPGENSYVGPPVPITGAPRVVTGVNNSTPIDFDASNSYGVGYEEVITGYGDALTGTYSASTENGAHVATHASDGNDATYWQATAQTGWLEIDFGDPKTVKMVYLHGPTSVFTGMITFATLQYYDGADWQYAKTGLYTNAEAPTYFYVFGDFSAARWRVNIVTTYLAGNAIIGELSMHEAVSGYAWDFEDGTPATSDEAAPEDVEFPLGFRWVHLEVSDTYRLKGIRHIPVLVTGFNDAGGPDDEPLNTELSYSGGTASASTYYSTTPPARAFDNDPATYWMVDNGAWVGWLQMEFPSVRTVWKYQVQAISPVHAAPKDFTLKYWDDGTSAFIVADTQTGQTSWSTGEVRTYVLSAPVTSTIFRLDITDNNGQANYTIVAELNLFGMKSVYYPVIDSFEVTEQRRTSEGQEMTFRIFEDIPLSDYPAGSLVMYWEDERHGDTPGSLTGPAGSQNLKFWGWIDEEPTAVETNGIRSVELRCVDVAGRMKRLWAPSMMATRKNVPDQGWYNVRGLNMDRWMYYLLQWHSNVLMLTDFTWSNTGDDWAYPMLEANAGSLWEQVAGQALKFDHRLTCDRFGRLWVKPDPQLLASADRTDTVQVALVENDVTNIKYTITATPRAHWAWADALKVSTKDYDDVTWTPEVYFAVSPGAAPGQGVDENTVGQRLAPSQEYLNIVVGNLYYVRMNAPTSQFDIGLAHAGDAGIEPADMTWITLTLSAAYAAQRGLTFTEARFLPLELNIQHANGSGTKQITLVAEREFEGVPSTAYEPEE